MPDFGKNSTLIDIHLIKVSNGHLPFPHELRAERMPGDSNSIKVSWVNDGHFSAARLSDQLMALHYVDGKFSKVAPTGINPSALQGTFTLLSKPHGPTYVFL